MKMTLPPNFLNKLKVDYDNVKEQFKFMITNDDDYIETPKQNLFQMKILPKKKITKTDLLARVLSKGPKNLKHLFLDNFGRDLTVMAEEGKLDPVVGREKEIQRVSQILSRRKKNNPLLIGEPGVGKSAIAEGLAIRIIKRKSHVSLFNKRVVTLDLASLWPVQNTEVNLRSA